MVVFENVHTWALNVVVLEIIDIWAAPRRGKPCLVINQEHFFVEAVYPVFDILKLEPCAKHRLPGHIPLPTAPVLVESKEEWKLDEILTSRIRYKRLQYLCSQKWYDAPPWEYADNITNAPPLIARFHCLYPTTPVPIGVLAEFEPREGAAIMAQLLPPAIPSRNMRNRVVQ